MKKILSTILFVGLLATLQAQTNTPNDSPSGDSLMAVKIIDNYLSYINFDPIIKNGDSVFCAVSYVIDRSHPEDTMTIYHWYTSGRRVRIEMWQDGQLQEGFYSDGKELFRMFRPNVRSWSDISRANFYDYTIPHDIRGALYDWRSKGSEVRYAGQYNFNGHNVDRVYVTTPEVFDRYYFFEKESGLLFMLTEDDHIFGDAKKTKDAQRVDWRAWHEFTPFRGVLLPSIESYQYNQSQIVFIYRHYHFEPYQSALFNEDYHKM